VEVLGETIRGISKRFRVGYADTIGPRRETMEDKMVAFGSYRNRKDEDYFAVFDGHGGTQAAIYASNVCSQL
jgi:serine/threonine protein phosphatase PrpC